MDWLFYQTDQVDQSQITVVTLWPGPTVLHDIGRMVVLDMVTNNFDRVPFVHRNFGNFTNIMVKGDISSPSNEFRAVSIDQGTTCITHEEVTCALKGYGDVDTGRMQPSMLSRCEKGLLHLKNVICRARVSSGCGRDSLMALATN